MANYPNSIYSPRTKANRNGVVYDENKETVIFVEDVEKGDDESVAIENELGLNPKEDFNNVADRIKGIVELPSTRFNNYNHTKFVNYLKSIHAKNKNIEFGINNYENDLTLNQYAYVGGVYSPTQNRIYLMPLKQANQTQWHYIDCDTGNVVAYTHGITAVTDGYSGGVYSPTENKVYFMPYGQTNQSKWCFIREYSQPEIPPSISACACFN